MRCTTRRAVVTAALACLSLGAGVAAGQNAGTELALQLPPDASSLEGEPTVRVEANSTAVNRRRLNPREAEANRLKIRFDAERASWTGRDGEALTVANAGEFTYRTTSQPGRYIRIRRLNDRWSYVEHLDAPGGSVTYWGELRIVLGASKR